MKNLFLFCCMCITIVACGSSSGRSGDVTNLKEGRVVVESLPTQNLNYALHAISQITVFADYNKNGFKDSDEPSTSSDLNGYYTIELPSSKYDTVIIRAIVNIGTTEITLSTPQGEVLISSITTLIQNDASVKDKFPSAFTNNYDEETLKYAKCIAESMINIARESKLHPRFTNANPDALIKYFMKNILDSVDTNIPFDVDQDDLDEAEIPFPKEGSYTAKEFYMLNNGFELYEFNSYNFCYMVFGNMKLNTYCNGGYRENNGKILIPTENNNTDHQLFPLHFEDNTLVIDDVDEKFYNIKVVDLNGVTQTYTGLTDDEDDNTPDDMLTVTFGEGAMMIEIETGENSALTGFDYFNKKAIEEIREKRWSEGL